MPFQSGIQWIDDHVQWVGLAAAVALGLLLSPAFKQILRPFRRLTTKVFGQWNDRTLKALESPVALFGLCAFWYVAIALLKFEGRERRLILFGLQALVAMGVVWALIRLVDVLDALVREAAARSGTAIDEHLSRFMRRVARIAVLVVGGVFVLEQLGFNVASLFAGLGLGGLAFALAARDTLANVFGSLMILLDKPFKIGDLVKTPMGEGTVEEIGFRSTWIRTPAQSLVSIPNSLLANSAVDNLGARTSRRLRTVFPFRPESDPEKIAAFVDSLKLMVQTHPRTVKDDYDIALHDLSSASADVLLNCYLQVSDGRTELADRQALLLDAMKSARKIGLEFSPNLAKPGL